MDMKGIETARRDNCALTRDIVDTSLRAILINKDVETAIAYIKMQATRHHHLLHRSGCCNNTSSICKWGLTSYLIFRQFRSST